ncbi:MULTISPECIES: response regulator transcription factor [unclassified Clostridioides]|uniref:response regulator transcription factor n=1 Tax=unclassified Clostridioides TaxID=2635829 RepID=UPI001D0C3610|nr:response regulator transcription factor [Clostridioides sp. ES-S-0001-02]MCC0640461.1 response regulator transcription factor [Clostridioides sp. ES-S-0049-03]MCC0657558.1 response regulator transcription factor [Clostridioides sp. ES-S-0123-01]MCC0676870.1 response regulator transcription factor [Clostridioides sp. ES-W-0018-02]MCC0678834.1 response regulator transcription factor [Clostridioides sp. ES-S-0005-03]MCC0694139.1 response regulator transcription factor [Clostridioides sp. ES-S-
MSKIKVLIVDDEKLIRKGLKIILSSYDDLEIIGDASNGYEALEFCKSNEVDVVLMDIRMNICDGVLGTRLIKEYDESIALLILTTFNDDEYIKDAMKFGASGYLLKDSSDEVLHEGIRSSFFGNVVLDKNVIEKIMSVEKTVEHEHISNIYNLTEKEISIIKLIADGLSNKEISQELFLSEGTIKNNITNILGKLELRDRTQLAIFAFKNKIVI